MKKWSLAFILFSSALFLGTAEAAQSTQSKIEGKGDSTSEVVSLQKGLLMVGAAHKGEGNFVVQLLSTGGEKSDLLVNAIGDYQGVRLIPVEAGRYRFQVRAGQAWVLLHEQPDPSKAGTPLPISQNMKGDAPLGPFSFRRGLLQTTLRRFR